ncbi:hypothetical protein KHC28_00310 [Ancylobacter sonchi]|uniref:hypothetical protein n=1 Tax=Ancylobacter sonchi TaxID=1937790 RepID=UPI001BD565FC|nr:hypothetical protein [Ancylobacter sonchi]MBS7532107.1 hypothetical protein [Ancylobacter sonchi]
MTREILPARRRSETFDLMVGNIRYTATFGLYDDGRPGELFIDGLKAGSDAQVNARDAAVLMSIALQYGAPVDVLRHAISRTPNGAPQGPVGMLLDRFAEITAGEGEP